MKKYIIVLIAAIVAVVMGAKAQTETRYYDDFYFGYSYSKITYDCDNDLHTRVVRETRPVRVIQGGKVTEENVIQYDTHYVNRYHKTKTIYRDIYENDGITYEQPTSNTNEYVEEERYYVPQDGSEKIIVVDKNYRRERPYGNTMCFERLGLNYVEGATWTVNFNMDSYAIPYNGYTNGRNIAEFAAQNPNAYFDLYGYADIETGTYEYNYALINKRNEAVRKMLIKYYGISPTHIAVHVMKPGHQNYAINAWNRCVIIKATLR